MPLARSLTFRGHRHTVRYLQLIGARQAEPEQPLSGGPHPVRLRCGDEPRALSVVCGHRDPVRAPLLGCLRGWCHSPLIYHGLLGVQFYAAQALDVGIASAYKAHMKLTDGGRPTKAEDTRRDQRMTVTLSAAEHAEIRAAADAEGLDVATFVRRCAIVAARAEGGRR